MRMKRIFVWNEGTQGKYEEPGWLPGWFNNEDFDPGEGLSVAHDMLEHRMSDTGQWHEECMAFGAIMFTRMRTGVFRGGRSSHAKWLGEELIDLWFDNGEGDLKPWTGQRMSKDPTACMWATQAIEGMKAQWQERSVYEGHGDAADYPHWLEDARRWMLVGYAQAERRYKGCADYIGDAFSGIEKAVNGATAGFRHELHAGCRLVVTLDDVGGYANFHLRVTYANGIDL